MQIFPVLTPSLTTTTTTTTVTIRNSTPLLREKLPLLLLMRNASRRRDLIPAPEPGVFVAAFSVLVVEEGVEGFVVLAGVGSLEAEEVHV